VENKTVEMVVKDLLLADNRKKRGGVTLLSRKPAISEMGQDRTKVTIDD